MPLLKDFGKKVFNRWFRSISERSPEIPYSKAFLSWILAFIVIFYFVFCCIFLSLRYLILPNINKYKSDIEYFASEVIDRKVKINSLKAEMIGVNPKLTFQNLVIHNSEGIKAITLPDITTTISWVSILKFGLHLQSLEISGANLEIVRNRKGLISVGGIFINNHDNDSSPLLNWMLAQKEILIRDGLICWRDNFKNTPELILSNLSFFLKSNWKSHKLLLKANPPNDFGAPIDLRVELDHPNFIKPSSDYDSWIGELYVDIRKTNIDLWKNYLTLPYEVSNGYGSIKAWLNFKKGVVEKFTADLALKNLSLKFDKKLEKLDLVSVNGRVSAGEVALDLKQKLFSFGKQGHAITLKNFTLSIDDNLIFPNINATHLYVAADKEKLEHHEIKIDKFDVKKINFVSDYFPLGMRIKNLFEKYSPYGNLENFSVSWDGNFYEMFDYKLSTKFSNFSIYKNEKYLKERNFENIVDSVDKNLSQNIVSPTFKNLSGELSANKNGGILKINSKNTTINFLSFFPNPSVYLKKLNLNATWKNDESKRLKFFLKDISFSNNDITGNGLGNYEIIHSFKEKKLSKIDLEISIAKMDISNCQKYLPKFIPQKTKNWIRNADLKGDALDLKLRIKDFPNNFIVNKRKNLKGKFKINSHDSDFFNKNRSQFEISTRIENGEMLASPIRLKSKTSYQKSSLIKKINGNLIINNKNFNMNIDSASLENIHIKTAKVSINDIRKKNNVLLIESTISGNLDKIILSIKDVKKLENLSKNLDKIQAFGNASIDLNLVLPLSKLRKFETNGKLYLAGNKLKLSSHIPSIDNLYGQVDFSNKNFVLDNVSGVFLKQPVNFTGGVDKYGSTKINFDGFINTEKMLHFLPDKNFPDIFKILNGNSPFDGTFLKTKLQTKLLINSSLKGISINLPEPLKKEKNEKLSFGLEILTKNVNLPIKKFQEINIDYGDSLKLKYLREKAIDKNSNWVFLSGGIGVNQPPPQPISDLSIVADLNYLDINKWKEISNLFDSEVFNEFGRYSDLFENYLVPKTVILKTKKLLIFDRLLDDVDIGGSKKKQGWKFNIKCDQALGTVLWNFSENNRDFVDLTAYFKYLVLSDENVKNEVKILKNNKRYFDIAKLHIESDNFEFKGLKYGKLVFKATNSLVKEDLDWVINKFALVNEDLNLEFSGIWKNSESINRSDIDFKIDIKNAGSLLNRLGYENIFRGGYGKTEGKLSWKGSPFNLDISSLNGNLSLNLSSGQFLKVEPGVAKLLGVLSLQSLPRRLTLDFTDIFSEGFQFDGVSSTALVSNGILSTKNFKMSGANAVVLMDGDINLSHETQDLNVIVIPELNAGGASVVYALAVNPVIGIGSFLAQLFLQNPLSQAFTQKYNITGPWQDPIIKKIDSTNSNLLRSSEAE